jgi:CelD/BcsL family acetyltransferase involved in cellulose biosynthesis
MRTFVIHSPSELDRLVPRWRTLLQNAVHAQPVMTPLWLLAWWREFGEGEGRGLRVLSVEDEGELIGLVPLSLRTKAYRRAIPVRRLELLGTGEDESNEICSEYVGAIAKRGREHEVASATARSLRRRAFGAWDELHMPRMSGDDPFVHRLAIALSSSGIATVLEQSGASPYVPLPSTWDEYLRLLPSSRRYLVTRSLRELEQWAGEGRYALRVARTAEELTEGRTILRDLHAERWEAAGRAGVFSGDRFTRFHDEVMRKTLAGEDGISLELGWLEARGKPIAATYNLVYANRVYFYQGGRSVHVPLKLRPGIAMHALSIRRSIEARRSEYDFLGGTSRYKMDLALATRPLVTLRAVAPGLRARAVEVARNITERAIARVRAARSTTAGQKEERATE